MNFSFNSLSVKSDKHIRIAILGLLIFLLMQIFSEIFLTGYIASFGVRNYLANKGSYIITASILIPMLLLLMPSSTLYLLSEKNYKNLHKQLLLVFSLTFFSSLMGYGLLGIQVYISSLASQDYAASLWAFKEQAVRIYPGPSFGNQFISIILFASSQLILAPIVEEILFRGIIFKRLSYRMALPFSMIISSILFTVLHPAKIWLPVFLSGIVYCYIFFKTKNLAIPILAHSLENFFGWLMTGFGFFDLFRSKNVDSLSTFYTWRIEIFALMISVPAVIYFIKILIKVSQYTGKPAVIAVSIKSDNDAIVKEH